MTDFIKGEGLPFMAHLLRRLSDEIVRGFAEWSMEEGIEAPPRTHSTIYALEKHGALSVTELASMLRQSHPLIIKWVRQLGELGFAETRVDPADRRRTMVMLTPAGKEDYRKRRAADMVLTQAFQRLFGEMGQDVFEALWNMEEAFRRETFAQRLKREKRSDRGGRSG